MCNIGKKKASNKQNLKPVKPNKTSTEEPGTIKNFKLDSGQARAQLNESKIFNFCLY